MKRELIPAIQIGLTLAIFWSLVFFFSTILHILTGYPGAGFLNVFKSIYLGYNISWGGAVVGLIWAFIDGFLVGYIFVRIYEIIGKKINP